MYLSKLFHDLLHELSHELFTCSHHELPSSLFRQVLIITGGSVNCFALKITLVVHVAIEQEAYMYIYTGLRLPNT